MYKTAKTLAVSGLVMAGLAVFAIFGAAAPAFAASSHPTGVVKARASAPSIAKVKSVRHSSTKSLIHRKAGPKAVKPHTSNETLLPCSIIPSGDFAGLTAAFVDPQNVLYGYYDVENCDIGIAVLAGHTVTTDGLVLDGNGYTGAGIVVDGGTLYLNESTVENNCIDGIFELGTPINTAEVTVSSSYVEDNGIDGIDAEFNAGLNVNYSTIEDNGVDGIFLELANAWLLQSWVLYNGCSGVEDFGGNLTVTSTRINGNGNSGVFAWGGHVYGTNSIFGDFNEPNKYHGIELDSNSTLHLTSSSTHDNLCSGISIDETSYGWMSGVSLNGNGHAGLEVYGAADFYWGTLAFNYVGAYINDDFATHTVNIVNSHIGPENDAGVFVTGNVTLNLTSDTIASNYDGVVIGPLNVTYVNITSSLITENLDIGILGCVDDYGYNYATLSMKNSTLLNNFYYDAWFTGFYNNLGGNNNNYTGVLGGM
jgi:hypothetical protein